MYTRTKIDSPAGPTPPIPSHPDLGARATGTSAGRTYHPRYPSGSGSVLPSWLGKSQAASTFENRRTRSPNTTESTRPDRCDPRVLSAGPRWLWISTLPVKTRRRSARRVASPCAARCRTRTERRRWSPVNVEQNTRAVSPSARTSTNVKGL